MDNDHTSAPEEGPKDASTEKIYNILFGGTDGSEKKHTFTVDPFLLDRAQYIKKQWLKARSETDDYVNHPHPTSDQFEMCFEWLRSGEIREDDRNGATENTTLAVYYMLGEAMVNTKLMNQAVDAIIAKLGMKHGDEEPWFPGVEFVNTIYLHSEPDSPGRRLMVDIYVKEASADWLRGSITPGRDEEQFASHFVSDLMLALLKCRTLSTNVARAYKDPSTGEVRSFRTKSCFYHHHAEGESCGASEGTAGEIAPLENAEDASEVVSTSEKSHPDWSVAGGDV